MYTYEISQNLLFFKSVNSNEKENDTAILEKNKIDDQDKKWFICSVCSNKITKKSDKTKINSCFEHSFTNPHGFLFTINCFIKAEGCYTIGNPSNDFTWFPGYRWEISICSKCSVHLGWKFTKGEYFFFGLIKDMLIEEN